MNKLKSLLSRLGAFLKKIVISIWRILSVPAVRNSILAIVFGLLVGFLILLIVLPKNAFNGFWWMLTAGASDFGKVLFKAAPLIMVGLAVGFAFKTGLFNIGASGQFMIGGVAALYVANLVVLPAPFHFILAVLVGGLVGAIWGAIPGALKAFYNVNEVIATIMMNYIAMIITYELAQNPAVYDSYLTSIDPNFPDTAAIPTLGLNTLFGGSNLDISILIAIGIAVLIWFVLEKTTLGYQLKAVGHSVEGSRYAGINYRRNVIVSMTIAGAMAGFGAAFNYLALKPDYFRATDVILSIGFEGISVALIAASNPIGIIFSGIFLSYIKIGAEGLQLYLYNKEIANIVFSVIMYTIAISGFLGTYFGTMKKRPKREKKANTEVKPHE